MNGDARDDMLTPVVRRFGWPFLELTLTIVTRLPLLLHRQPIINEAVYSVVANEIVDGGLPYLDAVEV